MQIILYKGCIICYNYFVRLNFDDILFLNTKIFHA